MHHTIEYISALNRADMVKVNKSAYLVEVEYSNGDKFLFDLDEYDAARKSMDPIFSKIDKNQIVEALLRQAEAFCDKRAREDRAKKYYLDECKTVTAVVQIGNSDNKLTQKEWSLFWVTLEDRIKELVNDGHCRIHFTGASGATAPWQNATWVIEAFGHPCLQKLRTICAETAKMFKQDSIALTLGETLLVGPNGTTYWPAKYTEGDKCSS